MTRICAAFTLLLYFAAAAAAQPKWVRERLAYEKACGEGDLAACAAAGSRLASGFNGSSGVTDERPAAAVPFYERACNGGYMPGCSGLARLHLEGKGVPKNESRAARLYLTACEGSDAPGCLGAADIAENGTATDVLPKDRSRASALWARAVQLIGAACDRGDGGECTLLGGLYYDGRAGLRKDVPRALVLYERACDLEAARGCDLASRLHFAATPPSPSSRARAEELVVRKRALELKACDAGDIAACSALGTNEGTYKGCGHGDPDACFELGIAYAPPLDHQPADGEKAAHFFIKGCEQGAPRLCTEAGDLYTGIYHRVRRQLLPPDYAKAAALFARGCEGGDKDGCEKLATLSAEGRGIARDPVRAAALFRDGCNDGESSACVSLGRLLQRGDTMPRSLAEAAQLYDRACTLGHPSGCYELALLHRDGQAVPRDLVVARKLLHDVCTGHPHYGDTMLTGCREACDLNDGSSCAALARAAARGSNEPGLQPRDAAPLYERAARLFETECEQGTAQSCYDLAMLLRDERPLRRDSERRARLLERACTLSLGRACEALARVYDVGGDAVPQDHVRSLELHLKACQLEEPQSCERAGRMLLEGDGLPADERRSQQLLERAIALKRKRGY